MKKQHDYREVWIGQEYAGYTLLARWSDAIKNGCVNLSMTSYKEDGNSTSAVYMTPDETRQLIAMLEATLADGGAQ